MNDVYKIAVCIPEEYVDELTAKINDSMEPLYPGYDMVFSLTEVTGMWRPLEGSNPFIGDTGKISVEKEIKVEFSVRERYLKDVVNTILSVHPYEEPAIDVIPMYGWKGFTRGV
ncbi:MAG: hypothetical protein ACOX1N_05075 [Candidatus Methanomethylophilaceae archaeon]|jgi:hypothetical protein